MYGYGEDGSSANTRELVANRPGWIRMRVRSLVFVVLASALVSEAHAVVLAYSGTTVLCIETCDGLAALGGPGGSSNQISSTVTGRFTINTDENGLFTADDIVAFQLVFENPAAPQEAFDGTNPATANPLPFPFEALAVAAQGSGIIDPDTGHGTGTLGFEFRNIPFMQLISFSIDLETGAGAGFLFDGQVAFTGFEGGFAVVPLPPTAALLPAALLTLAWFRVGPINTLSRKHRVPLRSPIQEPTRPFRGRQRGPGRLHSPAGFSRGESYSLRLDPIFGCENRILGRQIAP